MKDLDWDQIQEIYHEALELPPAERSAYIAHTAKQDPELMREVNSLVSVGASVGEFLKTPIAELPLTPPVENLIGTKIKDRYTIERELGSGGMGQLYLASDQDTHGNLVVLKFLSRELLENAYAMRKFNDESKALSLIKHPNVVDVSDTGDFNGRPFFVMQYVDGETLDQRIPKEGMRLDHAASILKQIGAALEHVHEKGVFHRDLKPTNIMLRRGTDSVVLVDFGIARINNAAQEEAIAIGVSPGTPIYMSPEQINAEEITAASDIYSMAVIAYEMVTGRPPFEPAPRSEALRMRRNGPRVKPRVLRPNLSQKAQDEILRGLAFKPTARYQNAKQFGDNLAQALLESRVPRVGPRWIHVLTVVLSVILLSAVAYKIFVGNDKLPPTRSVDYFLTVQRMHDGQPYQTPYRSHGEETFASGDNFRLTVNTPVDAFVYVFHEEAPKENATSFKMIFPRKDTNGGSANLGADKSIDSEWMTFREPAGVENFWIVWSTAPVAELEAVKTEAAGGLTGDTLIRVKQYLTRKAAEIKATTYNYNGNQTAIVRARHDLLVALAQFKHR